MLGMSQKFAVDMTIKDFFGLPCLLHKQKAEAEVSPASAFCFVVRVGRIELPSHPWQGRVLPLNHTRKYFLSIQIFFFFGSAPLEFLKKLTLCC